MPREPWQAGSIYRIMVDGNFAGASGQTLGTDFSSAFSIGTDREKPVLLKVLAVNPGDVEEFNMEGTVPEYESWESFTRLELVFSEPVDLSGLRNLLVSENSSALVMESPPDFSNRAVFRFTEYPLWGSSFLFRLAPGLKDRGGNESEGEYLFRITCRGPLSRPPSLVGIRLPMSPGASGDKEARAFSYGDLFKNLPIDGGEDSYPYTVGTDTWIELYFETAPGTEIDLFSLMDLFRVSSTNLALYFSPRSINTNDFHWAQAKEGWENFQRIEIRGTLTNSVHSGIVTFHIPPGLKDKSGNRSSVDFRISLLK